MNWLMLIILGIVLPSVGGVIGALMLFTKYSELKEKSHELDMDETEFRRNYFGRHMVFQNLFFTGSVYGVLIFIMLWIQTTEVDAPDEALTNIGIACTMVVGVSAFFSNITRGVIARKGFEALTKDPMNLGRAIVHGAIPDVCMIFGLLIAILALTGTGLLGEEFTGSISQSQEILNAAIVFSCASSGILLSAIFLNRVEEPFVMPNFGKGIVMNAMGTTLPIIGLLYVIIKFNEIGVF
jgi:F0F1-type ATP synthase membrane subunit c/vacuolar-type H+-ATPase subunit K